MFDDKQGMRLSRTLLSVEFRCRGAGSDVPNEYVLEHMFEYTHSIHMSEIFYRTRLKLILFEF